MRPFVTLAGFLLVWWAITQFTPVPPYMLPTPQSVAAALWNQRGYLFENLVVTLAEILLGLLFGTVFGVAAALAMAAWRPVQRWVMPILVISQAVPFFALAPLLVLWFGFGMASKIIMTILVIFFPITAGLADGLRQTEPGWLDLAATMNAPPARILWQLRLPWLRDDQRQCPHRNRRDVCGPSTPLRRRRAAVHRGGPSIAPPALLGARYRLVRIGSCSAGPRIPRPRRSPPWTPAPPHSHAAHRRAPLRRHCPPPRQPAPAGTG